MTKQNSSASTQATLPVGVVMCETCSVPRNCTNAWEVHRTCGTCMRCGKLYNTCDHVTGVVQAGKPTASSGMPLGGAIQRTFPPVTPYVKCEHAWNEFPFMVGKSKRTLIITAKTDWNKSTHWPSYGVYLDSSWRSNVEKPKVSVPNLEALGFELPADIKEEYDRLKAEPQTQGYQYPAVLVSWPDHGSIPLTLAKAIVNHVIEKTATEVVETGCIGAHGRTGTLVACLLITAEGMGAEEAVLATRKRHCDKAIEGERQIEMIFAYAGEALSTAKLKELAKR